MNATRIQRLNYVYLLLMVWFIFPVLLSSVLSMFGLDTVSTSVATGNLSSGERAAKAGYSIDFTYMLLLIIPVHFFLTFRRVKDVGWHPASTIVVGLPIINLIAWFWPGNKGDNKYGEVPEPARSGVKVFVFGFPIWAILISILASKFIMIGAGL